MIDLMIHAGLAVTMDDGRRVIEDAAIAVSGGRILAIGPKEEVERRFPHAAETVGGPFMAALPGFIDGHSHCGHGLVRTLGGDDYSIWRIACRDIYLGAATVDFWRADARLSALERIKAGVTTTASYLGGGDENNRSDTPLIAQNYADAFTSVGPRLVLGIGPTRPPYPRTFVQFDGEAPRPVEVDFETQLSVCRSVLESLPNDRVKVAITAPVVNPDLHGGPHFDELCDVARRMKALAEEYGAVLMIDGVTGGTPSYARGLGILNERTLLSHSINLQPDDIAAIVESGATVAHNPMSGSAVWGRCPVPELLSAGARVIVASDGLAPDSGADMFRVMRQCMHYNRTASGDMHVLPPGKVMTMTTIEPARFFGLSSRLGSLETGKVADIALVDLRQPHLYPGKMPLFQLAYSGTGHDVDTVVIDGKVAMRGRKVVGVDEDAILDAARLETERALERAGLTHLLETPASFWSKAYDRPPYVGPHKRYTAPVELRPGGSPVAARS